MNSRNLRIILIIFGIIVFIALLAFAYTFISHKAADAFRADLDYYTNYPKLDRSKAPELSNASYQLPTPDQTLTAKPSAITMPPATAINYQTSFIMLPDVATEDDILGAKKSGANLVVIFPSIITENNEISYTWQRDSISVEEKITKLINAAHKNGLQIELRTGSAPGSKAPTDIPEFRKNIMAFFSELAKFAEKNGVYQFTPFGEIDNGWTLGEAREYITPISHELLLEIRKHYSGKIGIGICCDSEDSDYNFTGYDYMAKSVYISASRGIRESFEESEEHRSVAQGIANTRKLASNNGIKRLIIGETGLMNKGEELPGYFVAKIVTKEAEAEYYETLFQHTSTLVEGYGIFYGFPVMSVKNEPSEKVVARWYKQLGSS